MRSPGQSGLPQPFLRRSQQSYFTRLSFEPEIRVCFLLWDNRVFVPSFSADQIHVHSPPFRVTGLTTFSFFQMLAATPKMQLTVNQYQHKNASGFPFPDTDSNSNKTINYEYSTTIEIISIGVKWCLTFSSCVLRNRKYFRPFQQFLFWLNRFDSDTLCSRKCRRVVRVCV